jgi:hypothetical protein
MGTIIQRDEQAVPVPSSSIVVLDIKKKPKTFAKSVLRSDRVIIDLLSGTDLEEAEQIIKILRQPIHESHSKPQVLVLISSVFTWANTVLDQEQEAFTD